MGDVRRIPHDGERVETGAVQFGNDWPGLFIRGDNAGWLAFNIGLIQEWFAGLPEEHRESIGWGAMNELTQLADLVNGNVIVS